MGRRRLGFLTSAFIGQEDDEEEEEEEEAKKKKKQQKVQVQAQQAPMPKPSPKPSPNRSPAAPASSTPPSPPAANRGRFLTAPEPPLAVEHVVIDGGDGDDGGGGGAAAKQQQGYDPSSSSSTSPTIAAANGTATTTKKQQQQNNNGESADDDEEEYRPSAKAKAATAAKDDDGDGEEEGTKDGEDADDDSEDEDVQLYKSTRLKGYITLCFSSSINYNAAAKSREAVSVEAVPATKGQQQYAVAVAVVSIIITSAALVCHLDRVTALRRFWIALFKPKSKFELVLILFLVLWWSIAVGVGTTINGIAGDGKGQYSLYYSYWACCLCSFWMLERWWVDNGWASFKSFISSWPYRAPAWICIMFLSLATMIWYVDLYKNHTKLDRTTEKFVYAMFASIPASQSKWLTSLTVLTFFPAVAFVLIELFRDIRPDGSNESKSKAENVVEGAIFFVLVLAWIPSVAIATTPGGLASLIGNAYFFTWILVVFLFEGLVWWIHDYRLEIHQALREKANEYRQHQRQVLEQTKNILGNNEVDDEENRRRRRRTDEDDSESEENEIGLSEPAATNSEFEEASGEVDEYLEENDSRRRLSGRPDETDEFFDAVEGG